MKVYAQGDVVLVPVHEMPKGLSQETHRGRLVLAEGELTGHAHTIEAEAGTVWSAGDELRFLSLIRDTVITHDEHSPIPLPAGTYRIIQQREYSPEQIRRVAD